MGFKLPPVLCGCKTMVWRRHLGRFGSDGVGFEQLDQRTHKCCKTVFLDAVYSNIPSYGSNTPCSPCRRCETDQQGNCSTTDTVAPHGSVATRYTSQCSKVLILHDAVTDSTINATKRSLMLSRNARRLPFLDNPDYDTFENKQTYGAPIQCPPTNKLYECCEITYTDDDGDQYTFTERPFGPFTNCEIDCAASRPPNAQSGNVCEDNKAQVYGFGVTPCFIEPGEYRDWDGPWGLDIQSPSVIAGYKTDALSWWFLSDPAYESMLSDAAAIDPYANTGIKHSVVFHFTLVTKTIECCGWHCNCPDGNLTKSGNWRPSRCNESTGKVLGSSDKAAREKNVEIYAFVGFTEEFCGYTPERACEVLYEETE